MLYLQPRSALGRSRGFGGYVFYMLRRQNSAPTLLLLSRDLNNRRAKESKQRLGTETVYFLNYGKKVEP